MRRLAKNLILATAAVSAIFLVDLSPVGATALECDYSCPIKKICPFGTDDVEYMDFWGKFRDTVMPDPNKPQNNNPPKEMRKPKPVDKPKPKNEPKPEQS